MESVRASRRVVWLSACLLSLSLMLPAGQALAQDAPESAVDTVLDAIEALDFDAVADLVCEAQRSSTLASFDMTSEFEDMPGVDPQAFIEAITIDVDEREIGLLEQTGDSAVVGLDAIVDVSMDESVAREFVALMLGMLGDDVSDEDVDVFTEMMLSEMQTDSILSRELDVVREEGVWRVCSDLSDLLEGSETDGEFETDVYEPADASADSLCELMSIEELNGLGALSYVEVDASMAPSCLYAADLAVSGHAVSVDVDPYSDLDALVEMFSDVFTIEQMDVAGYRSMWMEELQTLYVDSGVGVVMVNVYAAGSDDLAPEDVPGYAVSVADFVVPRFIESQG